MAGANGSVELHLLAKRLKTAGAVGVRREMMRGLRAAASPLVPLLQEAARADLPKRGGLNEYVAAKKITVSVTTGARTAGVRLRSKQRGNYTDTGTWRHPVFGKWLPGVKSQTYAPAKGWWDKTVEANSLVASAEARRVLTAVAAQVNGLGI